MDNTYPDIEEFLKEFWGEDTYLATGVDIFHRFGIDGDDGFEFIEQFSNKHKIDLTDYRWYFHHGEEGLSFGGLLFKPPYERVDRIPITPELLAEAIHTRQWPLNYPQHELPKTRIDLYANRLMIVLSIAIAVAWVLQFYI